MSKHWISMSEKSDKMHWHWMCNGERCSTMSIPDRSSLTMMCRSYPCLYHRRCWTSGFEALRCWTTGQTSRCCETLPHASMRFSLPECSQFRTYRRHKRQSADTSYHKHLMSTLLPSWQTQAILSAPSRDRCPSAPVSCWCWTLNSEVSSGWSTLLYSLRVCGLPYLSLSLRQSHLP